MPFRQRGTRRTRMATTRAICFLTTQPSHDTGLSTGSTAHHIAPTRWSFRAQRSAVPETRLNLADFAVVSVFPRALMDVLGANRQPLSRPKQAEFAPTLAHVAF